MFTSPRRKLATPLLAVAFAAVGCASSDGSVDLAVPTPTGKAAQYCSALHKELPATVDQLRRGRTEPASDFTAVWGDPGVQLRCGVPKPGVIQRGNEHYNPTAPAGDVAGVEWLMEQYDGGFRYTTVLRKAYVEVTVPKKYAAEVVLSDLADAVKKTVPKGI